MSDESEILITYPPRNRIKDRDLFIATLAQKLAGRVEEAYLFGSVARNEWNERSDIDLILVVSTQRPFAERILDFEDIQTGEEEMDILIYTPAEFAAQRERQKEGGFWANVARDAIRIV